jgi:AraC-like DNA-binding protein
MTPDSDAPILPWAGAVRWRHVPRAAGSGLGAEIRPSFAWMGAIAASEPYAYAEHRHVAYELIAVRRGPYRCLLDGQEVRLDSGGLLIVPPGSRHADRLEPPVVYVGLSFSLDGPPLLAPGRLACAQADTRTLAILDALESEASAGDRCSGRVQDALMQELFWRVVRALPVGVLSPAFIARLDDEAFPARFARACEERLAQHTALSELARACGLSASGLVAACRRHLDTTPIAALGEARLRRARDLLAGGGHAVKDVAAACGFANPFHFSRAFKRRWGVPPSAGALTDM